LHTNDAPGAITRLMDLGAEHFLLASTLSGLMAQRLMKKVCPGCAVERILEDGEVDAIRAALPADAPKELVSAYGTGCVDCRHTGYRGRSAIYEMFEITDPIKR